MLITMEIISEYQMAPSLSGVIYNDYSFFKFKRCASRQFLDCVKNTNKNQFYQELIKLLTDDDLVIMSDEEVLKIYLNSKKMDSGFSDEVITVLENWYKQKDRSEKINKLGI